MPKKTEHDPSAIRIFFRHFIRNLVLGFSVLLVILVIGVLGSHRFENMGWLDSFTNASMIVAGVGTLSNPETQEGKIFIATYSIFGGATFLLVVAVVFAPVFHWLFRHVKVEDREHFKD